MYNQSHIIKLSLSYLSNTITISISKSKLLSEVKDRAYKLFFPIKGRIVMTYFGKELTVHEGKQISAIFKDLKKALIIITVPALNPYAITQKNQHQQQVTTGIGDEDNKSNTIPSIKAKRLPSLSKQNNFPRKKIVISPTRYKSLDSNSNKLLCFDCCEQTSNFYCRNCNLFLCSYCRNEKRNIHRYHNLLEINVDDLKNCSNSYKDTLIGNLTQVRGAFNKIEELKVKGGDDNNYWVNTFDNLMSQLTNVTEDLNNFVPKVDMRNISSNIVHTREFEKEHEEALLRLEAIHCSSDTDPFELFSIINTTEKQVARLFEDVKLLNQYNGVQRKIVNYFIDIEAEIDRLIQQTNKQHLLNQ